jgi:hypothetical protein
MAMGPGFIGVRVPLRGMNAIEEDITSVAYPPGHEDKGKDITNE